VNQFGEYPSSHCPAFVLTYFHSTTSEKGIAFTQILIISVTLIVVAVPEGLPLAMTLALAFATERMTAENLLVRILGACETMANTSIVCTDKTRTLTQNVMSVVTGSIGIHAKFVHNLKENRARTNAPDQDQDQSQELDISDASDEPQLSRKHANDFSIEQSEINSILSPQLKVCLTSRSPSIPPPSRMLTRRPRRSPSSDPRPRPPSFSFRLSLLGAIRPPPVF
jgi:magnesium-transporting ATPase (P-type)